MKKKHVKIIAFSTIAFVLTGGICSFYFSYLHHYKGSEIIYNWAETDTFDINSIKTVEKKNDKDFVIMNLTDIQLSDIEDFWNRDVFKDEIDYLIKNIKPDLITFTGDQTWSNENLMSLKSIIRWVEKYDIPWAPVFGNHDQGNPGHTPVASVNKCCDLYEKADHCLFSRGPSNLGSLGNYVINIKEGTKIIKTLYMIDSGVTDYISDQQKAWVKWNADNIKAYNNNTYVEGMAFMHKPIPEYYNAMREYENSHSNNTNDVYYYCSIYGSEQNGFFDVAKSINIKEILSGHQHANNFSLTYSGIRLSFACKTGQNSFYYNGSDVNLNGATYYTIKNSSTDIKNFYVPSDMFNIEGSENIASLY